MTRKMESATKRRPESLEGSKSEAMDVEQWLHVYEQMVKIREFEEKANELYLKAIMPGLTHLYSGQEAVAVGVCEALNKEDYITSTHRGHGHCLAKGASMLDSPVSGSVVTLEEGRLSLMVGGDANTFEKVKPILLDIGPKATYVGANGLAVTMKIATNLSLAVQMLAFSEGVLLAEKSGIKRETAVEVLVNSVIASPMVKNRGPFVLEMPGEAWFDCYMMQKDMNLALELGRELSVPLPTTAATNEFLSAARGMGFEKQDFAVIFDVLAKMSGVER